MPRRRSSSSDMAWAYSAISSTIAPSSSLRSGANHDEDIADHGDVSAHRSMRRGAGGVAGEANHARGGVVHLVRQHAGRDEHPEPRIEFDVVMFGARSHVVLAGETAVHQRLNEVTAGTLLGFVDAALPQHLRTDDRGGLLGNDGVLAPGRGCPDADGAPGSPPSLRMPCPAGLRWRHTSRRSRVGRRRVGCGCRVHRVRLWRPARPP